MALTRTVSLKMFAETKSAQAKLDAIEAEANKLAGLNPSIKPQIEKAAALRQMAVLRAELKAEGDKAGQDLGTSISDGTKKSLKSKGGGGSWIAAAVGLGAPLTGPLAAGGLAFAAFGALAAGSLAPVAKAMTGPGGLAAGWATLDARQKTAAAGVQALKTRYDGLSRSMEPRAFQVFNTLLSTANSLLGPSARLATTSGAAVEGFLVKFENDSGLRRFIGYASTVAPQAIGLLGGDVTSLVHSVLTLAQAAGGAGLFELRLLTSGLQILDKVISALPAPLEGTALGIGGVALGLSKLGLLSRALKITGFAAMGSEAAAAATGIKDATIATRGLAGAQAALDAVSPFGWVALGITALGGLVYLLNKTSSSTDDLISRLRKQDQATGFNTAGYEKLSRQVASFKDNITAATGPVHGIYGAISTVSRAQQELTRTQQEELDKGRNLVTFLGTLQDKYGLTRDGAISLARAAGVTADQVKKGGKSARDATTAAEAYADSNRKARQPVIGLAAAVTQLTAAMQKNIGATLTLQGDEIAWKQSQQAALTQLRSNSAGLDGNTKNALANRQAVLSSSDAVMNFAAHQLTMKGNLRQASRDIQAQITWLQRHGDKSKFAAAEIKAFRQEEALIRKQIRSSITVTGTGSWSVRGGNTGGAGHPIRPGQPAAAGWRVTGGIPGVDSVPILAQRDETVLSVAHSRALAPLLSAIGVPGYAAGGVIGNYHGSVPGLGKWLASEQASTVRAVSDSVAAAFKAAKPPPGGIGPFPGGGASGPGPAAAQAYALSVLPAYGWGLQQMLPLIALWNQESGWRWNALNASSGAYGIPQSLPASKMAAAGPDWMTNPATQIRWGLGYIKGRYGSPAGAEAHELAFNWYGNGLDAIIRKPTLIGVGEAGAERVQVTPVAAGRTSSDVSGGGPVSGSGGPAGRGGGGGASAAERRAGMALLAWFSHLRPGTSTGAIRSEEAKYLRDIARYFSGSSAKWRDAEVKRQTGHLIRVGDKIGALNSKIAAARSYQQSVRQGLSGFADLSQMTLGGSMQGSRTLSGAQSLNQQLHGQLGTLKTFAQVLRKLSAAKVSPALIRQVVALGPGDGTAFGQEILAGGPALIKSLNATEKAIGSTETAISRGAASAVYEGKYRPGKNFLSDLQHEKAGLQKLFREIGAELGREAARWFHARGVREHPGPPGRPARHRMHPGLGPMYAPAGYGQPYLPAGYAPAGPVVHIENVHVRETADIAIIGQRVGFAISAAGLG